MTISQKTYHEMLGDCQIITETKFEIGDTIWYIYKAKHTKTIRSAEVFYVKTYKDGLTVFGCTDETRRRGDKIIDIYLRDIFNSEQDAVRWLELDKEKNNLTQHRNFNRENFISISREMNKLPAGDFHLVKNK